MRSFKKANRPPPPIGRPEPAPVFYTVKNRPKCPFAAERNDFGLMARCVGDMRCLGLLRQERSCLLSETASVSVFPWPCARPC